MRDEQSMYITRNNRAGEWDIVRLDDVCWYVVVLKMRDTEEKWK